MYLVQVCFRYSLGPEKLDTAAIFVSVSDRDEMASRPLPDFRLDPITCTLIIYQRRQHCAATYALHLIYNKIISCHINAEEKKDERRRRPDAVHRNSLMQLGSVRVKAVAVERQTAHERVWSPGIDLP